MDIVMSRLIEPGSFVQHPLHDPLRSWPETNCYVDLWIEVLAFLGEVPEAAFGFTVTQDYEDDQFTFSKIPAEDLRCLYGLSVQELSVYRSLEQHVEVGVARGNIVLMEVDAYYLPDTAATTYRRTHTKTTIAIDGLDTAAQQCGYFHNAARGLLAGEDYLGAFRMRAEFLAEPDLLPPYVEIVRRCAPSLDAMALQASAIRSLRRHLSRRPARNPFSAWRRVFARHVEELMAAPLSFHDYAFHFPRQAGANFELLGSHATWLDPQALQDVATSCARIAQTTKIIQFRLARSVARRRPDPCLECFDTLEADYDQIIERLQWYVS